MCQAFFFEVVVMIGKLPARHQILFVDDEPGIRMWVGRLLEEMGYVVMTAEGGEEALEIMGLKAAGIVITDIRMPGMDGVSLLQAVKRWWPLTEVIVLSGHSDFNMAVTCLKHGASDFLPKPVDDESLEVAIQRAEVRIGARIQAIRHQEAMESELSRLRSLFGRVFDASPSCITVQGEDFTIQEANRTFESVFGKGEGRFCYDVYRRRETPCPGCPMALTLMDGQVHTKEMVVTTKQGVTRNMVVITAPLFGVDGDITGVVETATDMTLVRNLEDRLRSLGLMAGSLSHGIKGLLTRLDAGAHFLEQGLNTGDIAEATEGWRTVRQATDAMAQLALRMLYMAKPREHAKETVELGWLLTETVESVRAAARSKGVNLSVPRQEGQVFLKADVAAMRNALTAILENAVDACRGLSSPQPCVTLKAELQHKTIRILVVDTGCGMSEEVLDTLFTPFFSTKGAEGTGLGLFLAKQVVEEHQGTITVDSAPALGTTVAVTLPRWKRES
jgi:signal transduction histidine kinase